MDFNQIDIDLLGVIYWNNREVNASALRYYLQQSVKIDPQPELRLHPDAQAKYDVVDKVMAEAQQAGVTKMGFVGNEAYAN